MAMLRFAAAEGMALLADEVYQENVYGAAPKFTSFKSAYCELCAAADAGDAEAAGLSLSLSLTLTLTRAQVRRSGRGRCRGGGARREGAAHLLPLDVQGLLWRVRAARRLL